MIDHLKESLSKHGYSRGDDLKLNYIYKSSPRSNLIMIKLYYKATVGKIFVFKYLNLISSNETWVRSHGTMVNLIPNNQTFLQKQELTIKSN